MKSEPLPSAAEKPLRQRGLRQQLIIRFGVVFVVVTLAGSLLSLGAYRLLQANSHAEAADQMLKNVRKGYEQIAAEWQQEGEVLKTQIDFMRLFADRGKDPWVRLLAYFSAMEGKVQQFESGVILHADGSKALGFGRDGAVLTASTVANRRWYYSETHGTMYELVAVPLWLGSEGIGRVVLLQAVSTAHLRLLAPLNVTLFLVIDGKVVTSSEGSADVGKTIDVAYRGPVQIEGRAYEQRAFPRFGTDLHAPHIVMRAYFKEPLSTSMVLLAGVTLLALLSLVLWLVVGRWAQDVAQRVVRLSSATTLFAGRHELNAEVHQRLDSAMGPVDEITEVAQSSRDLMHSVIAYDEEHFAFVQTLDILEEGVVELDRDGRYMRASPGWAKLAGSAYRGDGLMFDSIHPEDVKALKGQFAFLFSGAKTNATGRLRLIRSDGPGDIWVEYRFVPGGVGPQGVLGVRGVLRDITQSYLLEKHISHMALHDALTGLPNRVLLEDRAKIAMRMADRGRQKVAIAFIDLDHFKDINDHFGHTTGDQVLISLAESLKQCLRSGDTLARWGGDEFVVLLPDISDLEGAREVAAKLITACERPIDIDGTDFNVTFSMGVAVYPDDASTTEVILSQADRAMFFAKDQGRNNVRFFADVVQKDDDRRILYIQNRLAAAIKNQQIQVWFQPVVSADGRKLMGCEALARWHDENYGWVSPATFIPMAENLGLISELGLQVWHEALKGLQRWREMGVDLHMAVNVSRRQLFTPSFTEGLLTDLEAFAIPALCVELEITESVAMEDAQHTSKRLQELMDAGFGIAIDDFGTGYSSLSQLHNMPASKLKIDISFVRRVHEAQGAQLLTAIVQMAQAFKLKTVAEGVEDAMTATTLQAMGVDLLQGYYFGKPMPADEFERRFVSVHAVGS